MFIAWQEFPVYVFHDGSVALYDWVVGTTATETGGLKVPMLKCRGSSKMSFIAEGI